jgi:hypothetical protein
VQQRPRSHLPDDRAVNVDELEEEEATDGIATVYFSAEYLSSVPVIHSGVGKQGRL